MASEISYAEILEELQKLSKGKPLESIKGARTMTEWQLLWGVSDKPARIMLSKLKEAGCVRVVKKQVPRLDGTLYTCNAFVIELKPKNNKPPARKNGR